MLTEPRLSVKPLEYPAFLAYRDAIRHSYWLHTEYNLTGDVQDFRVRVGPAEREVIRRALLAIAQVEVVVKTFWGDVYHHFPKPEVGSVGYTFAESEVRHQDAYAHLLEILGLNDAFERLPEQPPIKHRIELLGRHLARPRTAAGGDAARDYALTIVLFSVLVEHVGLFGQFLILKAFNRHRGLFKGVANIIDATSQEEQIHGLFGHALIHTLRGERPEWFDGAFQRRVDRACEDAYRTEAALLDWIFGASQLDFLTRAHVDAFLRQRLHASLLGAGFASRWQPQPHELTSTQWFEEELLTSKHLDFFDKRPTAYSKKTRAITAEDLFAEEGLAP